MRDFEQIRDVDAVAPQLNAGPHVALAEHEHGVVAVLQGQQRAMLPLNELAHELRHLRETIVDVVPLPRGLHLLAE